MLISVLIGLTFGLIITYGMYLARTSLSRPPRSTELNAPPIPNASPQASGLVSLLSPEDETIQAENTVKVAGTTQPNSYVVVFVNNNDTITTSDTTGNFSVEVTLEAGSNVIAVHMINESGTTEVIERTVIVSTASLDNSPSATSSADTQE